MQLRLSFTLLFSKRSMWSCNWSFSKFLWFKWESNCLSSI